MHQANAVGCGYNVTSTLFRQVSTYVQLKRLEDPFHRLGNIIVSFGICTNVSDTSVLIGIEISDTNTGYCLGINTISDAHFTHKIKTHKS